MKRVALFVMTNLAVLVVIGTMASLLGLTGHSSATGLDLGALLGFCALFGFGGALISLAISKQAAKWSTGARVITGKEGPTEAWLVQTVEVLAQRSGISMPEVAIYRGAPNAFATGARRNAALVAVSTGLLEQMRKDEVEAVLAHEVAHVANGDMVTLTLVQGVMNTFVMFAARVVGHVIDRVVLKNNSDGPGIGYYASVLILDILFGILAALIVAAVSRHREFKADAGAADLMGTPAPMVSALRTLAAASGELPKGLQAFGIAGGSKMLALFASHPPIEKRIEALARKP